LVVAALASLVVISAKAQEKMQFNVRGVAATETRVRIDAHAVESIKDSDVPSVAVAYIENRKIPTSARYASHSAVAENYWWF
jgi:hypothetical protein